MITSELRALVACPACIESGASHGEPALIGEESAAQLVCPRCGARYAASPDGDYLDLRPPAGVAGHETRYARDAGQFASTLGYRTLGPPLLGAAVRQFWLRRWLPFHPGERVLDAGCGDGRFAYWNRGGGARITGLDAAPLFADVTRESIELVRGDLRTLPFPSGVFDAVYSIDVMEHLDAPGLDRYFGEISRVLKPSGRFFLYSNTRERSTLWPVIALWNWLGGRLRALGIGAHELDDLRKSDHVKVLRTYEELVEAVGRHGLRVERIRFWNGVFQGLIDNVLVRFFEWLLLRRRAGHLARASERQRPVSTADHSPRQAIGRNAWARTVLRLLTGIMQLDVLLFGRLRSGPFFALLVKEPAASNRSA